MIAVNDLILACFHCVHFACNDDIPKFNRFTISIRCAVEVVFGSPVSPCVQLAIVNFNCRLIRLDGNKCFAFYAMIAVNDLVLACLRYTDSSCDSDIPKFNRFTISIRCAVEVVFGSPVFPCVQLAIVNFNCRLIRFDGDNGFAFYAMIAVNDLVLACFCCVDCPRDSDILVFHS